jgi:hypothetical protein
MGDRRRLKRAKMLRNVMPVHAREPGRFRGAGRAKLDERRLGESGFILSSARMAESRDSTCQVMVVRIDY